MKVTRLTSGPYDLVGSGVKLVVEQAPHQQAKAPHRTVKVGGSHKARAKQQAQQTQQAPQPTAQPQQQTSDFATVAKSLNVPDDVATRLMTLAARLEKSYTVRMGLQRKLHHTQTILKQRAASKIDEAAAWDYVKGAASKAAEVAYDKYNQNSNQGKWLQDLLGTGKQIHDAGKEAVDTQVPGKVETALANVSTTTSKLLRALIITLHSVTKDDVKKVDQLAAALCKNMDPKTGKIIHNLIRHNYNKAVSSI